MWPNAQPPGKGYTLIELLIVLAIIGLLAGLIVPSLMGIMPTRGPYANVALEAMGSIATADSIGSYREFTGWPKLATDGAYACAPNFGELTGWRGRKVPGWLQVEFKQEYVIREIGISIGSHRQKYRVSLSRDGDFWQPVLDEMTSPNPEGLDMPLERFLISPTRAKYMEIDILWTSAPRGHIFQASVLEIQAWAGVSMRETEEEEDQEEEPEE